MNTIILDTEATGLEELHLVQLSYHVEEISKTVNEFFKPPKPIEFSAMAVCHITNEMVADKQEFMGSETKSDLQELLNDGVLVAHYALFDIGVLRAEGVKCEKYICTKQCAQHLLDYEGSYSMQELRYALDLKLEGKVTPHDALSDVLVLKTLFKFLLDKMEGTYEEKIQKMIELTQKPLLLKNVGFGKHKGLAWSEVPKSYLLWLSNAEMQKPEEERDQNILLTTNHYL
jgi:exodeoxyribonuclease X